MAFPHVTRPLQHCWYYAKWVEKLTEKLTEKWMVKWTAKHEKSWVIRKIVANKYFSERYLIIY